MTAPDRCPAAHPDDPTDCEGQQDAVRVVDQAEANVLGCVHHATRLLASLDGARVYPKPGHDGAALEVYYAAQDLPPFVWQQEAGTAAGETH